MLRHPQVLALQCNPPNTSPLSHGSQTTSSTLSALIPSSKRRFMSPKVRVDHESSSLPNTRGPRKRRRTQERQEAPTLFTPASLEMGDISRSEAWWRDWYYSIRDSGYKLRPRYHPRWEPSWIRSGKDSRQTEDGQSCQPHAAIDATCIADGRPVLLRKCFPESTPNELVMLQMFSSHELRHDPHNHCVPLLEVIDLSRRRKHSRKLLVMPLLRQFDDPPFQTYGEFVAFFTQICEGLQFMHKRNIAHRNFTADNIKFDPSSMYPKGYHPIRLEKSLDFGGKPQCYTRTRRAPRYYITSFGLSRQYSSRNVWDVPDQYGGNCAPELRHGRCNPFHTDVYDLGNIVRSCFLKKYDGFEFIQELVDAMTRDDPARRPTIEQVVKRFARICASLSTSKLRSAVTLKDDPVTVTILQRAKQFIRTLLYVVHRRDAIPLPSY